LNVYLEKGILRPDNNLAENAIRTFIIGRNYAQFVIMRAQHNCKYLLFAGSPEGAHASALFYSLMETAKINNLNPEKYLRFILEKSFMSRYRVNYWLYCQTGSVRKQSMNSWHSQTVCHGF
jgi:hypothetical protein